MTVSVTKKDISSFKLPFSLEESEILQDIRTDCRFTAQNIAPPSEIMASP